MNFLRVKNWTEFQHYKDRSPPWIKLSTSLFQDYEFSSLSDASKLLAVCIWTLASRYKDPKEGLVPDDLSWIKSQCGLGESVTEETVQELVDTGFLSRSSETLAPCLQSARPETEAETEAERARVDEKAIRSLDDLAGHPLDGHYENWFREKAPGIDRFDLRDRMISYCRAKNKKYADYWAALQNWARDAQGKLPAASPAKRKANDENAAYLADLQKRMEGRVNVSGAI